MPVATHTLTGDFSSLIGEVQTIRATLATNSADGAWVNEIDDEIRLGGAVLDVDSSGEFSVVLPTSTDTGLQYQVTAEYVDESRKRQRWTSGWFTLTANADLADRAADSSLRVSQSQAELLGARIDDLESSGVGGSSSLIVAGGGTIDLDDSKPDGYLIGYRLTATTTVEGASFAAGSYIFERDTSAASGWTYRTLALATDLTGVVIEPPPLTLTETITALTPGHYWPLESNLTPTAGAVTLTNVGSVTFTDQMAVFNGTTQRLEAPAPLPHDGATALSFVAKIKLNSNLAASANYGVMSNPFSTSLGIYDVSHWALENIGVVNGTTTWTAGVHVVGLTWDGSNIRLYRDGILDATRAKTGAWPAVDAGNKFTIAGRAGSSTFTGSVSHVAAWKDVALSDADMLAIAEAAGVA